MGDRIKILKLTLSEIWLIGQSIKILRAPKSKQRNKARQRNIKSTNQNSSVWQKPLQYCEVISLQLIKISGKKRKKKQQSVSNENNKNAKKHT